MLVDPLFAFFALLFTFSPLGPMKFNNKFILNQINQKSCDQHAKHPFVTDGKRHMSNNISWL